MVLGWLVNIRTFLSVVNLAVTQLDVRSIGLRICLSGLLADEVATAFKFDDFLSWRNLFYSSHVLSAIHVYQFLFVQIA
jgi:hypothetical protein